MQNYHSLNLGAERKFESGLYFQLGWTWAKNLTDCQGDDQGGCAPQNPYARSLDYGDKAYSSRHRVTGTLVYELPFGRGKLFFSGAGGIVNGLIGGWRVNSSMVAQTGLFFTPMFNGFDVANTGVTGTQRADRVGNGNLPTSARGIRKWFDKTAFMVPGDLNGDGRPDVSVGRYGNSAPNVIEGPGALILDGGLQKQFMIGEKARATLEGTFTNVLNHPNYGGPNVNIRSGAVGTITGLFSYYGATPRNGRLGLRIDF